MTSPVDLARASVRLSGDGSVVFADAGWTIRLWIRYDPSGRPRLRAVRAEHRDLPVNAARLARLPLAQMVHVAAREEAAVSHPNEVYYRMLAQSKAPGQRHWDGAHYERVLTVCQWARDTRRPGGGVRAIADLWAVTIDPTAYRWLAEAKKRAKESASS